MSPQSLKNLLKERAEEFADTKGLPIDTSYQTAALFKDLDGNFFRDSFEAIQGNPNWSKRLAKQHNQVPWAREVQSSSSSDALLMNIFCHPKILKWKGVRDLLGLVDVEIRFGVEPGVEKGGGESRPTEIDMEVGDLFVEAKLTEPDFCSKEIAEASKYSHLSACFDVEKLPRRGTQFTSYQIVRNLLASIQHGKRHALFCDERRPDLVRSYLETVNCLKDANHRSRCRVIFWQEIAQVCGKDLKNFLQEKYGIH
jgi:hypothetical protein